MEIVIIFVSCLIPKTIQSEIDLTNIITSLETSDGAQVLNSQNGRQQKFIFEAK